jgi:hypothetical protein
VFTSRIGNVLPTLDDLRTCFRSRAAPASFPAIFEFLLHRRLRTARRSLAGAENPGWRRITR